ncbi:MAG TPA: UDP-N-acetylglucosamine 1-carboxyvinyltransferase [Lachnospiraceae bacterium]|nr:UDP-N-acetylglucosamine 1-carboxyvinyltransferase [Lachnospiraceae bacterium]
MEHLLIRGKHPLNGDVNISGAKNAVVAIIPAAILAEGVCIIDNLPKIEDVSSLEDTLTKLGAVCELIDERTLMVDSANINDYHATFDSVRKIRASYYLMGALLARFGKAEVALPGGCNFGSRPINLHLKGFRALGAEVVEDTENGIIRLSADKLVGTNIFLDTASVGATINIMLAAVRAEGVTTIENAAKEPHIVDTANFLNMLGCKVRGAGTDVIKITGVESVHGGEYMIIPDQIEAGTYMLAAAACGGDVTVRNLIPKHMDSLSAKLKEMGCGIEEGDDFIRVVSNGELTATNVKTMAYPGFPTDLQPQMAAVLCKANGTSKLVETVWENRFQYVAELNKFGCDMKINGSVATIEGHSSLKGTEVFATDLRAGAAMVIAGLAAEGETKIGNTRFIDRGYENIEEKLRSLGADIERIYE